MDLEVDSDGLREARSMLDAAGRSLSLPGCLTVRVGDDVLGPSASGREAADLFTRRAEQSVEAISVLGAAADTLGVALALAADSFDRLEAALGPR